MTKLLSKIPGSIAMRWNLLLIHLGEDMCDIMSYGFYILAGYHWLLAVLAPMAESCRFYRWNFFKMWQKLCFSVACLVAGYGFFRVGRSFRIRNYPQY